MKQRIKTLYLIVLIASLSLGSFGFVSAQTVSKSLSNTGLVRYMQPGLDYPDYPPLPIEKINHTLVLPSSVDNSTQPYMRPVFNQSGSSVCEQSATVGYNFCYEINRLRNLPADTSLNLYPDHFTYNFMNATKPYYGQGVSYFHTFDILYDAGNPNEAVYGPMNTDDYFWMSGYEKYYLAMQNRISGVNSINVGTPEGLLNLKHWLHNHLDGSDVGGIANFQAGIIDNYYEHALPPESSEAGKFVMIRWSEDASHSMTIVGYNDSIRFDRNGDGAFTNDIDINADGKVDMKDWEIGGLKFVNSYGHEWWGNEGYCYMMYSTLAEKYGEGGIWNNAVHVLFPDTTRDVLLTMKVNLRYNKRGRIKLSAGISNDTSRFVPEHTMDFSIFNYQGGDFHMNGNNSDPEGKNMELGLDITPLLSFMEKGKPARIFLIVDEKDPDNSGEGEILDFEVIRYNENIPVAFKSNDTPTAITNNNRTLISAIFDNDRNPPEITLDEIQLIATGNNYDIPAYASGGTSPYTWQIQPVYNTTDSMGTTPPAQGEVLIPTDDLIGYAAVHLPFDFHFFGHVYDSVYMHVNGYLMFERADMPFYYLLYDESYFRQVTSVAGCMSHKLGLYSPDDYLQTEIFADKAVFYWRLSNNELSETIEFSVTILPDGSVSFQYGSVSLSSIVPLSGVSSGNSRNYYPSSRNGLMPVNGEIRKMTSGLSADVASVDNGGVIALQIPNDFAYGQFLISVKDKNSLSAEKLVTLTTGPAIQIKPSDPSAKFSPGAKVPLSVTIENKSATAIENAGINLTAGSSNAMVTGSHPDFRIEAGETVVIKDAFSLKAADSIRSVQSLKVEGNLSYNGSKVKTFSCFASSFANFVVSPPVVVDLNNNIAEPGEKVELSFDITNMGNASAGDMNVTLSINSPYATLCGNSTIAVGELGAFSRKRISFPMQVNEATPSGALLNLQLNSESQLAGSREENFRIALGSTKIVVIDMDKNKNSAVHIQAAIRQSNINCDRIETIDSHVNNYDIVFLCLGSFQHNHVISPYEDSLLVAHVDRGGGLYLEGNTFFKQNQPTMLRRRLGVTGATQAFVHGADTLVGVNGTPVQEIKIDYRGEKIRGENLLTLGIAESWLRDKNSGLNFVVARDSADIKTIASTAEFGGYFMFDGPGRSDLVAHYLDFLGMPPAPFCASFSSSTTNICAGSTVSFISNYSQTPTSWYWSFPGGTPNTWNGPEPIIKYDSAGVFDVELLASNGIENNTFSVKQMIFVDNCNSIFEPNVPSLKIYPNPAVEKFIIDFGSPSPEEGWVTVSSVHGQSLKRLKATPGMQTVSIATENLKPGIYIVSFQTGNNRTMGKVVIL